MTQNALLFIPDISGFTEFVHNTSINHSTHIIAELLEILLDENKLNFELAEIEGDALFFYTSAKVTSEELQNQIKAMYIAFHQHLKRYDYERICQCGACSSAYNLCLKFIVHYGPIDFVELKGRKKPHGSSVIQIHRLLKNKVPHNEYTLMTESALSLFSSAAFIGEEIEDEYDFGKIKYQHQDISSFKSQIPYVPPIPTKLPKHRVFSKSFLIESPTLDLYEVISNFDYRLLWNKGIDKVTYDKNKVNRSGIKHQCLIDKRNQQVETVSKNTDEGKLVYGETTSDAPLARRFTIYYVLNEIDNGKTELTVEVFADFYAFAFLIKYIMRKNLEKVVPKNMKELILLINSGFKIETT